jgi:uncharacterized protein YraI
LSPALVRILAVLAGLVTALTVATAAVFVFGNSRDDDPSGRVVASRADGTAGTRGAGTPGGSATRAPSGTPRRTVSVRADGAANVRTGPGVGFAILTALEAGESAPASARDVDSTWLLIDLPAGTGWVAADVVEVVGDIRGLPVSDALGALRTPTPSSTPSASATRAVTPSTTPTPTRPASSATATLPTATATAVAAGLPDLVLSDAVLGPAGRLTAVITNAGPGSVTTSRISIIGLDDTGNVAFGEVTTSLSIAPGGAVNVEMTYRPASAITLTVVINADGSVDELTSANNRRRVTLRP